MFYCTMGSNSLLTQCLITGQFPIILNFSAQAGRQYFKDELTSIRNVPGNVNFYIFILLLIIDKFGADCGKPQTGPFSMIIMPFYPY